MTKKYYCIAGEASGDLHGANLIKAMLEQAPQSEIRAWGGDLMQAAGAEVVKHYRELAFMGFVEVLRNLPTILRNMRFCKADILAFQPDVLVLIDYPGFNMRIAKWAKQHNIKVVYYISPQIWAWNQSRVHKIKATVDKMLCILPFELDFYKKYDYDKAVYVGHPLLDAIPAQQPVSALQGKWTKPIVAVLAGSREQEVRKMLEIMLSVAPQFTDYQFVIAGAPTLDKKLYDASAQSYSNVGWVSNQTYDLLRVADAALVASGTATLEVALFGVPEVVCFRGNAISVWLARRLIDIKFISLVNLIMDRKIVTELIQNDFNTDNLTVELQKLLSPTHAATMKTDYAAIRALLAQHGESPSQHAAREILEHEV